MHLYLVNKNSTQSVFRNTSRCCWCCKEVP